MTQKWEDIRRKSELLFQKGLLQISRELHMSVTGSYPELYGSEQTRLVDYLRHRLNLWKDGKLACAEFDLRVKDLITTAINEYDQWLEKSEADIACGPTTDEEQS